MTDVTPRWKTGIRRSKRNKAVEYAKARAFVYERSGGRCEASVTGVCVGRGDQAHHVRRRSQGGTNDPSNLLWICSPCHDFAHSHPAQAEALGLLERSSFDPAPGLISVTKVKDA